jgi:hypothetical protein
MYSCLTRNSPISADLRLKKDALVPAVKIGKEHYSQELLEIIDNCLDLDYLKRPQSVFSLQKSLMEAPHKPKPKTGLMHKIFNVLNKHQSSSSKKPS